jgi:lysophospholipase L1-like esterase
LVSWDGSSLKWAADGATYGALVPAATNGIYYLPGASASQGLFVTWYPQDRTYTNGTCQVTGINTATAYVRHNAQGFPNVAQAYSQQRLFLQSTSVLCGADTARPAIYGMSGASTTEFLKAQAQWSQISADVYVVELGTNDVTSIASAAGVATAKANLLSIYQTLLAKGGIVIALTIPPRNANTTNMRKALSSINRWIYDTCASTKGIFFCDITTGVVDTTNGNWLTGYSSDGVHPSNIAADVIGQAVANVINNIVPEIPYLSGYDDVYDATYNPTGNRLATAGMASQSGTGGGVGTGATPAASVSTGFVVQRYSGSALTLTCSKVARTDINGFWQQIAYSAAAANEAGSFSVQATTSIPVVAGEVYEALAEVNITAGPTGLTNITFELGVNSGAGCNAYSSAGNAIAAFTNGAKLLIKIPRFTVPSACTFLVPSIQIGSASGGAGTIQIGRIVLRKVA